ncbi:hypothetical protein BO94DRAFT_531722, partial [Aspergillus sclerotioniger CBS 115572]
MPGCTTRPFTGLRSYNGAGSVNIVVIITYAKLPLCKNPDCSGRRMNRWQWRPTAGFFRPTCRLPHAWLVSQPGIGTPYLDGRNEVMTFGATIKTNIRYNMREL